MAVFPLRLWQDRELHFDLRESDLELRPGEEQVGVLNEVDDSKGSHAARGKLRVTNLRIIWQSNATPLDNISIGFDCILNIDINSTVTKLRGHRETLRLMCRFKTSRLEFVFSSIDPGPVPLFRVINRVYRSFHNTKTYRDIKKWVSKREHDYSLQLERLEQLYDEVRACMSVMCDNQSSKKTDGVLYITNVRIVWHCATSHKMQCDYSIPYVHIKTVSMQETTKGDCIMVKIAHQGDESIMQLEVKPKEKTHTVAQMLMNLHKVFTQAPIFAVEFEEVSEQPKPHQEEAEEEEEEKKTEKKCDDKPEKDKCEGLEVENIELQDDEYQDGIAAYYASNGKVQHRNAVFCPELGLAIEELPEGVTLDSLWQVFPPVTKEKQEDKLLA